MLNWQRALLIHTRNKVDSSDKIGGHFGYGGKDGMGLLVGIQPHVYPISQHAKWTYKKTKPYYVVLKTGYTVYFNMTFSLQYMYWLR